VRRSIVISRRVAAVAMCVASSTAIAPAHADSRALDSGTAYRLTLERFGLTLSSADAFAQGVGVCMVMDEPKQTVSDVATQVMRMHPTWNAADARHFVGAAQKRYCPDTLPLGAHTGVCSPQEPGVVSGHASGNSPIRVT
jgi:Protein of unknown function (DUF732)